MNATAKLTEKSLELFLWYTRDAANWGGHPYLTGNRTFTRQDRGNLTQLKKAGLLETRKDEHGEYISFTQAGKDLSLANGFDPENW